MNAGVVEGEARMRECPLESGAGDRDCEHMLLSRLGGPPGPVHHPAKGRLDPRHPIQLEGLYEPASGHWWLCDLAGVRLVDDDRALVVPAPHLSLWDVPRAGGHHRAYPDGSPTADYDPLMAVLQNRVQVRRSPSRTTAKS